MLFRSIKAGKIRGIEVFNHKEYYPETFDWTANNNLAFMGNTDVHALTGIDYDIQTGIRPMTLVLATDKSEQAIKEALFAGRSIALFNNQLAGKPEHLKGLVTAALQVNPINEKTVEVTNISDIPFRATSNGELYLFPAGKTVRMGMPSANETFVVENCFVGKNKQLSLTATDFYP